MQLAIFDLDHTLIAGDSDHAWGHYLARHGVVDADEHRRQQDYFYAQYRAGNLNILEFLEFQFRALAANARADLERWRDEFIQSDILPLISTEARQLVENHRAAGHQLMIITATNSFVTRPIADEFGIPVLLATEPEQQNGRFTGRVDGIPAFREGKIAKLHDWLETHGDDLDDSWFYSDSHNDLPLLNVVQHPVAVNPDPQLEQEAHARGWKILRWPIESRPA